jgi:hypothetical protein
MNVYLAWQEESYPSRIMSMTGFRVSAAKKAALGMGLDAIAINAVRQFRFKPATYNRQPIAVPVTAEISFKAT